MRTYKVLKDCMLHTVGCHQDAGSIFKTDREDSYMKILLRNKIIERVQE